MWSPPPAQPPANNAHPTTTTTTAAAAKLSEPRTVFGSERSIEDGSTRPAPPPPRYVRRNLPFGQSRNMVAVEHNQGWRIGKLVRYDLFHFLLRRRLYESLPLLLLIWAIVILIFAGFYFAADRRIEGNNACSLFGEAGPITYQGAFAFSLQTMTTVGYTLPGTSQSFFQQCTALQTLIFFQSVVSMFFNAFLLAFLYSRVARAESRSVQMLFSEKAIVSQTPSGQLRFQVRLYDVDSKHPVVEAKCRIYAVLNERSVPVPLRLIQPNDELGAPLFLSLPCVVAHHIDHYSAIHPPVELPVESMGLTLRQTDSRASGREEVICPVCGESFGTVERWRTHIRNAVRIEVNANYSVEGTHQELTAEQLNHHPGHHPEVTLDELRSYFSSYVAEVIVIVSAQDPLTSGSFQALQSYRFEDIVFDESASFEPCIYLEKKQNRLSVDLKKFHFIRSGTPSPAEPSPMLDSGNPADAMSPTGSYVSDLTAKPVAHGTAIPEGNESDAAESDAGPTNPTLMNNDEAVSVSVTSNNNGASRQTLSSEVTGPSSSRISDSLIDDSLPETR